MKQTGWNTWAADSECPVCTLIHEEGECVNAIKAKLLMLQEDLVEVEEEKFDVARKQIKGAIRDCEMLLDNLEGKRAA